MNRRDGAELVLLGALWGASFLFMRAGAVDFFEKPIDNDALLAAIKDALGRDAARLFRLSGLHPGLDFGAPAAASLAGVDRSGGSATEAAPPAAADEPALPAEPEAAPEAPAPEASAAPAPDAGTPGEEAPVGADRKDDVVEADFEIVDDKKA